MSNTPVGKEGVPLTVPLVPVESSTIAAVGYEPESRLLIVQFRNLVTYEYHDVPAEVHVAFMAAPSKGSYLHKFVKPPYRVSRLPQKAD